MYPSITKNPTTLLGKLDNCTLRFQEEKVLGIRDRKGGVGLLRTVRDLASNSTDQNLEGEVLVIRSKASSNV